MKTITEIKNKMGIVIGISWHHTGRLKKHIWDKIVKKQERLK